MKIEKYIDTVSNKELKKYLIFNDNGKISSEEYYFNHKLHREDGPAFILYYKNGEIEREHYILNDILCDVLQEMVIKGLEVEKLNGHINDVLYKEEIS